ncbi:MAG: lipoyl(octanoyl) transferase LipB [Bacteroidales bacterium]|nr:lipoyl(octanoyl) transferase LipB [Bacteroidales bacterium]
MIDKLQFSELGIIKYENAYDIQTQLFNKKIENKNKGIKNNSDIIICEHPHVYTIGKNGNENNLLIDDAFLQKINATYYKSNRGGDITYHGPGQLVAYPILDLDILNMGTKDYIFALEYMIIEVLKEYGIKGEVSKGNIGVWLDTGTANELKICSIGVKISRGITMHGLALNVNTDLSYFNYINPCGFIEKGVTSMKKELGKEVDFKSVSDLIIKEFSQRF